MQPNRRLLLVTGHRRENFGSGFESICAALGAIAERGDTEIVYPVHLNPQVQEPVKRILGNRAKLHLIEPLDYLPFVYLMNRATLVLTDSGGVQEEAPSLGKPVLVMRDTTEKTRSPGGRHRATRRHPSKHHRHGDLTAARLIPPPMAP